MNTDHNSESHLLIKSPEDVVQVSEQGRFRQALQAAKYSLEGAVVAFELLPITNEGSRYGMLLATEAITNQPIVGAAVLGGSTLLVEGAGAIAASDLLTTDKATKSIDWLNGRIDNIVGPNWQVPKSLEALTALYLGVPVSLALSQRDNTERTRQETRRNGLFTAAWVAGVCAVEGAAISEGIGNITSPEVVASVVTFLGLSRLFQKWAQAKVERAALDEAQKDVKFVSGDKNDNTPRYDLSKEELAELDRQLTQLAMVQCPDEDIVGVWIRPYSKYANFVRSYEASYFPEVENVSDEDEDSTLFFALVDTRPESSRVVHAATITGLQYDTSVNQFTSAGSTKKETGFYTVDELIKLGNFTIKDFRKFYKDRGIDVSKSMAVETNFRIGERTEPYHYLKMADIAYVLFYRMLEKRLPKKETVVFATVNQASIDSFNRFGIEFEPLMGRTDFVTPESDEVRDSIPIALTRDANRDLFGNIDLSIPEIVV
ncbi:MAG TPA: hypothetical protein VL989_01235 [Candidatus Sulfotelmatobacter sp.]|nr:hypothetical protein [Candidatus Sulfotelmatobacter sp.]